VYYPTQRGFDFPARPAAKDRRAVDRTPLSSLEGEKGMADPYSSENPQGYGLCPHGMAGRVYCAYCKAEDEAPARAVEAAELERDAALQGAKRERSEALEKLTSTEAQMWHRKGQAEYWESRYKGLQRARHSRQQQAEAGRRSGIVRRALSRLQDR
jgi:uncharacterized Zn finger protein (UPF0148 family)